jgi:inner membrane protein
MTWKSHIAIAAAITIPFNPGLVPVAAVGSTAPDWIEGIAKFFNIHFEHRKETHYLIIPMAIIALSLIIDVDILFWFGIGYLTHWFADSLTISGVPVSPWDNRKIHFFGGTIRTGETKEYVYSFGLLAISILLFKPLQSVTSNSIYNPYNMDYRSLYEKKIIDEKEMLEKRFKFF